MARENNDLYSVTADMDMDMVQAAIQGFVDGGIELPPPEDREGRGATRGLDPKEYGFLQKYGASFCKFTKQGLIERRRSSNTGYATSCSIRPNRGYSPRSIPVSGRWRCSSGSLTGAMKEDESNLETQLCLGNHSVQ